MDNLKNAILFLTQRSSSNVFNNYEEIKKATTSDDKVIFTYHNKLENVPLEIRKHDHFVFTDDILHELNYYPIIDSLVPGNNHFPLLKFYLENPNYSYYWIIEDDVRFNGNWKTFFMDISQYQYDFITCHLQKYDELPNWDWWRIFVHPKLDINLKDRYKSFNPIYRISNQAIKFIHNSLLNKWSGHHEILLPTLLIDKGFSVADFGKNSGSVISELKNNYYTSDTMRFRPILKKTGDIPNKLYHPVKNF